MLYIRNAKYFREYYQREKAQNRDKDIDLDFIDLKHPNPKKFNKGFGSLVFGSGRDNVASFLRSTVLNVAADQQSVYELIQNADDCDAKFISINYNDKYLLCINNGKPFTDRNLAGLINVGDSDKTFEEIGTYGIGFKIVHRLLGKDDGADAIINDYAGALMFSWSNYLQFDRFKNNDEIRIGYDKIKDKDNAWLLKLIYTCFPTHLGESIRLSDYETSKQLFDSSELEEFRGFLTQTLSQINISVENFLRTGSMFFLKLAEGKSKSVIEKNIEILKSGIAYSFNFLQSLEKIYINGESILAKKVNTHSITYPINSSEYNYINPRNKERNIEAKFGFNPLSKDLVPSSVPNIYNFFSMDDEKNNFGFLIHCNAFDMHNDRRKLQPDSEINPRLFSHLIPGFLAFVDGTKGVKNWNNDIKKNVHVFNELYATLLLTEEPKTKSHLFEGIYLPIKKYVSENIPTQNGYSNNSDNVKIKNTFLDISPSDFGCPEIEWFHWYNEKNDSIIINEARKSEKLNLEKYDIIDLIKYAVQQNKIENIDNWIRKIELETQQLFAEEKMLIEANEAQDFKRKTKPYYSLLSEINKSVLKSNIEFVKQIKLFKFSDGNFYSLNEIFESEDLILNYEKTFGIRYELQNIGFATSIINIDNINTKGNSTYSNIKDLILSKLSDLQLFQNIVSKSKSNTLRKEQKQKIFTALQAFDDVGIERLRDLELFKNSQDNVKPLGSLLKGDLSVPNWLFHFKILIAEYTPELDRYLLQEKEIYKEIILPHWDEITQTITDVKPFYEKVVYYFGLEDNNTPLLNQNFIYLNDTDRFVSRNSVFYNSKFSRITKYRDFQDAIFRLTDIQTPHKDILPFLGEVPFKTDNEDFFDCNINHNIELSIDEIKAVLAFCQSNNENFFASCIIEKQQNSFRISTKTENTYQVRPTKEVRTFIKENLSDILKILPFELDEEYKEEKGVIQGEPLYNLIINNIDIDEYKEQLVHIIHYDNPRRNLLMKLSEIRLISEKQYNEEDFEYRVLEWACNPNILTNENDIQNFRNSIVIEAKGEDIRLSIVHSKDKIEIEDHILSLAKILPDTYQNSDHLSNLINQFDGSGLNKGRIEKLFGIKQKIEPSEIFDLFSEQTTVLQNAEQLSFLLIYAKVFEENIENFKVETLDEKEWELRYDYYLKPYSFIGDDYLLKSQYSDIIEIFDFPISIGNGKHQILLQPYFAENKFVCPNIKSTLSDEEKTDLLSFLFAEWQKDKTPFSKEINWSKINDTDTITLLGFNPKHSVFPNQYACEKEQLPEYVINWINTDNNKIRFVSNLGIWTGNSVIIDLRKFLIGEIDDFQNNRIEREESFYDDETMLFNTFEWLKENEIELQTVEQFSTFKKVTERVNNLKLQEEYDFELLEKQGEEWEKIDTYAIYLFERKMPIIVGLNKIKDYIFYHYNDGDFAVNNNIIYINKEADQKETLQIVALDKSNGFSFEELWRLFGENTNDAELAKKEAEIQRLKNQLQQKEERLEDLLNEDIQDILDNHVIKTKLKQKALDIGGNLNTLDQFKQNLIAKVSLLKHLGKEGLINQIDLDDYNNLCIEDENYKVYSSKGEFAHIQPTALLQLKQKQCKIAIYYGAKNGVKIFSNIENLFELNDSHIFEYQVKGDIGKLLDFLEKNNIESYRYLLTNPSIIKPYKSSENKTTEIDSEASDLL